MALYIRNREVEELVEELARLTNESKTEVVRQALLQRKEHLKPQGSGPPSIDQLREFLESRVWPTVPHDSRRPWTKEEEEKALGYGESGEFV